MAPQLIRGACAGLRGCITLGHVYVEALVGDPRRLRVRPVRLLVDTGATYLSLPPSLAEELGLRVEGEAELTLADGRTVMAGMALAWLEVAGRGSIVQAAVLDVDEPLLGVMALEALGLAVDPTTGELRPTRGFLARA